MEVKGQRHAAVALLEGKEPPAGIGNWVGFRVGLDAMAKGIPCWT